VERVISQIASRGGRRLKLRYLGTAKNNAGSRTAPPHSICATSSATACTTATGHGRWPDGPATTPRPLQLTPPACKAGYGRKRDHFAGPRGLAYYRTDGHCRRSSRPRPPLFSGLLEADIDHDLLDDGELADQTSRTFVFSVNLPMQY
jgi:hypothetical protein